MIPPWIAPYEIPIVDLEQTSGILVAPLPLSIASLHRWLSRRITEYYVQMNPYRLGRPREPISIYTAEPSIMATIDGQKEGRRDACLGLRNGYWTP